MSEHPAEAQAGCREQMKQQCPVHFMCQELQFWKPWGYPQGTQVNSGPENVACFVVALRLLPGSRNYFVSVKVSLGEQEFVTRPKRPHGGKTALWNSDSAFTVFNLTDKLFVAICDAEGVIVSSTAIEVPTIVQEWFREDYVSLDEGGHIHLKLNFILTKEERKRLESRRAAGERKEFQKRRDDMLRLYDFKRKEEQCVNNGLRTIAEKSREHAGQPLDNWEIFSKKKGKEVFQLNSSLSHSPDATYNL